MAKPASGATLNTGNALTTGLDFFLPILVNTGNPLDIINNVEGSFSGNAAFVDSGTSHGTAISFDGIDDYVGFTNILSGVSGKNTTVFFIAKITGLDSQGGIIWSTDTGNTCYWRFQDIASGTIIQAGSGITATGMTWADSTYHLYVMTNNGTTVALYRDGTLINSASVGTTALSAGNKNFHLGNFIGGTSWDIAGEIAYFGFYGNRCLDSTEVTTFNNDPYALLSVASSGSGTGQKGSNTQSNQAVQSVLHL